MPESERFMRVARLRIKLRHTAYGQLVAHKVDNYLAFRFPRVTLFHAVPCVAVTLCLVFERDSSQLEPDLDDFRRAPPLRMCSLQPIDSADCPAGRR